MELMGGDHDEVEVTVWPLYGLSFPAFWPWKNSTISLDDW